MEPLRQKARFSDNGAYVTRKQLKFIKSCARYSSNSQKKLRYNYKDILDFYMEWMMSYNTVYDLNELDPKAGYIYWNESSGTVSYHINSDYIQEQFNLGNNLFEKIGLHENNLITGEENSDDDEDENNNWGTLPEDVND